MKAIVCEMCSSNDVVKQDGLYVCQSCGTKYTVEDAKKLMADVSGSTVKIDDTDKKEKLRQLAREARQMSNAAKAGEYYNQLVVLCPDDWEAMFFSVYYISASCVIAQIEPAARNVSNVVRLITEKISHLPETEKTEICNEVVTYTLLLKEALLESAQSHQVKYGTTDSYAEFCQRKDAVYEMAKVAADAALACGLKHRATNIYESLIPAYGKVKVAKLVEALEYGRGKKLLMPDLEALRARQKKDRITTFVMLGLLLAGIVGTVVCAASAIQGMALYVCLAVAGFGAFMSLVSIPINLTGKKKVKKLEDEIANLRD